MEGVFKGAHLTIDENGRNVIIADTLAALGGPPKPLDKPFDLDQFDPGGLSPERMCSLIRDTFHVPLVYEWSYVEPDWTNSPEPLFESFEIRKGQTLRGALDQVVAMTQGALQWKALSGLIYVFPSGKTGAVESVFDTPISIHMRNASTWEALKLLCETVMSSPYSDRGFGLGLGFLDKFTKPPPAFTEERCITLRLDNVTAREALCAIVAASPVQMSFDPGTGSGAYVWFYTNGRPLKKRNDLTPEELEDWYRRLRSCARYRMLQAAPEMPESETQQQDALDGMDQQ
jgi:hypothetical protein